MLSRSAAALAAFTTLLLLPTAAHAALGGANALTTSLRPDLRTATIQSTNLVDDTTTTRVCFSKGIASLPQAAEFFMGTYAGGSIGATSATRSTSNCADAVFPNSDAKVFTFVSVRGSDGTAPDSGNSAVSTNGFGNIMDSTALIGSDTHNGTRGFSDAPDLVGITVNNAEASIDFTFDQRVGSVSPLASAFAYNTSDATLVGSLAGESEVSEDGLTVRAFFPPGPQIQDAVRAFPQFGAVDGWAAAGVNGLRSAARPGNAGFTDAPDLVAVNVQPDGRHVDFQFDQVLNVTAPGNNYFVQTSNGAVGPLNGTAEIVGGANVGNTVRVECAAPCPSQIHEQIVAGFVFAGVVGGPGGGNTPGGLPAGGNAGAFATGFTAAPEALSVTFDNATDVARVLFDQRWIADNASQFKLLDDQGSQISAAAINVSGAGAPAAGRTTAEITFPAGTLAGARSLLLQPGAVMGEGAISNFSQAQVISPTAPAANLKGGKFRPAKKLRRALKRP